MLGRLAQVGGISLHEINFPRLTGSQCLKRCLKKCSLISKVLGKIAIEFRVTLQPKKKLRTTVKTFEKPSRKPKNPPKQSWGEDVALPLPYAPLRRCRRPELDPGWGDPQWWPPRSSIIWNSGCHISSWWLNQPIWKVWPSKWVHLPQIGLKIKDIWVATTQISVFVLGDSEDATVITNLEDWDPVVNNPLSGSGCGTPFQIA